MFEIFQLAIYENLKSAMTPKVVLNSAITATRIYAYTATRIYAFKKVLKSIRGNPSAEIWRQVPNWLGSPDSRPLIFWFLVYELKNDEKMKIQEVRRGVSNH